jgi:hypothetical protein
VETLFIVVAHESFRRLCVFWRCNVILAALMDCVAARAILSVSRRFGANSTVNEASYAFIAAIIAGMPIMFMTRVIL